ncbi:NUDIX domain-containing protein [uncultured Corynebacterium sp.]|uniref:NUDIX domain-containing protein n=1 Tax=uncultured Corynebacterium sp. TaxID=159447 RepID=UPI0025F46A0F|nr:NUDIX hydrolase [uncultured Corynebacterium sp.]
MTELYRTLSSELLVDAPILALRRDRITTVTGDATREVVEHFGAAAVVAVRDRGPSGREVLLVRQYRRPVRRYLWELPAGILDLVGEDPLAGARRELAEEAGVAASTWHLLGDIVTSPGTSEEICRIFLAEGVRPLTADESGVLPEAEGEEADMTSRWVPVDEAVDMVRRGEVENSIAVAGLLHLAVGTRREVTEPFAKTSTLADRRSVGREPGTDMKHVR